MRKITGSTSTHIITCETNTHFVAGEKVVLEHLAGGTGLTSGHTYYVIAANLGANTFQVSATKTGSAIAFSTAITGGYVRREIVRGRGKRGKAA